LKLPIAFWDYGYAIEPSGVETYISYLRRKLDDRDARLIRTVRGHLSGPIPSLVSPLRCGVRYPRRSGVSED
jgi:hypothetical protein